MKLKLDISGMHCTMCAINIDEELEELAGVKRAKTSYAKQISEVEFDPAVAPIESLIQAVSAAGYEARVREK